MKKIILILITFVPFVTLAQISDPIVPKECNDGGCDLEHLVIVVNKIFEWLFIFTTSIATIMFAFAGFLYVTAQGDTNQISRATGIFKNVLIGFVIIILSFLLVKELLVRLGLDYLAKIIT